MKYIIFVLWYLVSCVKSEDGYKFEIPPSRIQSTDRLNPLKVNVKTEITASTTGVSVQLNPTPILLHIETTDAARPGIKNAPVIPHWTTTMEAAPRDNGLVNPTPVLESMRLETGIGNPMQINNLPLPPPLFTTSVVRNDVIKPTPVVLALGTTAVPVASTGDEEVGIRLSTGNVPADFIEPSQVFVNNIIGSITPAHSSQIEQGPKQVSTGSVNGDINKNVPPCLCKYVPENPIKTNGLASYDTENSLTPQITPQGSRPYDRVEVMSPNDIRQLIVSLQLNLYINNIPVLAANAIPLYFR